MKGYRNAVRVPFAYYRRDRGSKEMHLILDSDDSLMPIELKKTATPDTRIV